MKITLASVRKPSEQNINKDIQWVAESFGLFSSRDKEKSCFRIFLEILKSARKSKALSSDELAVRTKLTRATVIHHLNKLINSGLVVQRNGLYELREGSLSKTVVEIRKDLLRVFEDVESVAGDVDRELGLKKRQSHTFSEY